jgi:hypothetical protein
MEIQMWPVEKLVFYVRNPRKNEPAAERMVASPKAGRVCCAIELDPKYFDVAVKRWQKLSGQVVRLDGDGRRFDQIAQARHQEVLDDAAA